MPWLMIPTSGSRHTPERWSVTSWGASPAWWSIPVVPLWRTVPIRRTMWTLPFGMSHPWVAHPHGRASSSEAWGTSHAWGRKPPSWRTTPSKRRWMSRPHPGMQERWSSSGAWESMEGPSSHHSRRTTRREKARGPMTAKPTAEITSSSVILMRILLSSFSFTLLHSFSFFSPLPIPFLSFLCLFHFLTFLFNCSLLLLFVNCAPLHGLILLTQ